MLTHAARSAAANDSSDSAVRVCVVPAEAGACSRQASSSAHNMPAHEERELEDALSGLYAAIWSIGELLGTPIGGWLLGILPATPELNCSSRPHADATECAWGFHNTMQVFVVVIFVCAGVMLLDSLRIQRYSQSRRRGGRTHSEATAT